MDSCSLPSRLLEGSIHDLYFVGMFMVVTKGASLLFIIIGLVGASISILLGFIWVPSLDPSTVNGPESFRIIYWHVSFAWCSFLAFLLLFIGSIIWYLKKDEIGWRCFSVGSDMGLLFGMGVITSGPIWGSVAWGKPWDWGDLRLNSFALLTSVALFLVLARRAQQDTNQTRDTLSIVGLFGFSLVPITAMATTWYQNQHPPIVVVSSEDTGLPSDMLFVLILSFISFCFIFVGFSIITDRIHQLELKMENNQINLDEGWLN
ncbi:MAG: cytochrome c biogenesis protein CcsA [Candidatus Poseidoniales archaeon]